MPIKNNPLEKIIYFSHGSLCADLDNFLCIYSDSVFILAGDFNHLNTEFLSIEFGFNQLVTTAT